MTEFLLFCIATVGMTLIITQGNIFRPFRQFLGDWSERIRERRERNNRTMRSCVEWFNELINCAQCTGFWCGLFCGLLLTKSLNGILTVSVDDFLTLFCCGLGGSFLASLGSNLIDWIFYRKMNALRQLEEQDVILAERRANLERMLSAQGGTSADGTIQCDV
jgi:hypothetical protein